ncbi:MAG: CHASE3 domain-containing protein [Rhodospirillaceae bacterium]|nr:CHASE3 domain-containing protein [Rhodospirillaceae bacterium]
MHEPLEMPGSSEHADRLPASARLMLVSFILLVLVIGAALWGERQASRYAAEAFDTQKRELETVRMLSLLQDTETGQRGYLLTQDGLFLEPYDAAISEIAQLRESFKAIVVAGAAAQTSAERLDTLITERLALLREALDLQETGRREAAIDLVKSGRGKARMDEIRAIVAEIIAARQKLLLDQRARLDSTIIWLRIAEAFGMIVLAFTAIVIFRQSRLTRDAQRHLRESQAIAIVSATAANRAKSAFLATMSHELRTPMTAILGMCDLLLAGRQSPDERQITQLITRNAQSLLLLLNDILDLSKVEAGRLTFESVDFRLSSVLDEVQALFGPVASQKGLILKITPNPGPNDVFRGDPKRLQQVLINLIGNAIKFTLRGQVTVTSRQSIAEDGRTRVEVEVEDTGEGVSDEAMKRLFREFEQEDVSTSRRFGGSGLGLSISKRIVEALGGSIGATSTKGRGSCFFFSLPLAAGDPARIAARISGSGAEAGRRLDGLQLNILLAEDTPATQFLVTRMFTLWGHAVTLAVNGEDAVKLANERKWDIILMDMQMPLMDGPQATQLIREGNGPSKDTPIIALTADAVVDNRKLYLDAGCNVVATKPIDWAILAHNIATLLGHGGEAPQRQKDAPKAVVPWNELPLLNRSLLDEMAASLGKATLAALVTSTLRNLRLYSAELGQFLAAGDLAPAMRRAHQIEGSAGQIGAERAAGIARAIESESKKGVAAGQAVESLVVCFDESAAAFDAFFAS